MARRAAARAAPWAMLLEALVLGIAARALSAEAPRIRTVEVASSPELFAAVADDGVNTAVMLANITVAAADLEPFGGRIVRSTNFLLTGPSRDPATWPVLDLSFVAGKVILHPRVTLNVTWVVIVNYTIIPSFQGGGIDLLLGNSSFSPGTLPSMVVLWETAFIAMSCMPTGFGSLESGAARRPGLVPGTQQWQFIDGPASSCNNSTSAPLATRCWPSGILNIDYAAAASYATNAGRPAYAGYVVWMVNAPTFCSWVMPLECVQRLGPVACHYQHFPRLELGGVEVPAQATRPPYPGAAAPAAPPVQNEPPGSDDSAALLGGVLGGVLGGLALLAVLAFAFLRCRHRRPIDIYALGAGKATAAENPSTSSSSEGVAQLASKATGVSDGGAAPRPTLMDDTPETSVGAGTSAALAARSSVGDRSSTLVPVTPLTPVHPGLNLNVHLGSGGGGAEVQLLPITLGKGSCGKVVKGVYEGRPVAVKLLNTGLLHGPLSSKTASTAKASASQSLEMAATGTGAGGKGNEPAAAGDAPEQAVPNGLHGHHKALAQEVEVLARVQHPNIIRLLAANLTVQRLCLVMEQADTSLEHLVHGVPGQLIPLPTVLHIASQVAQALAYLHPTILHRDLKPGNVLIFQPDSPRPLAKLADFGLSRLLTTVLVTTNPEVGTAPYLAPEAFEVTNIHITDRIDVYAFGMVVWEMLTGNRPWGQLRNLVAIAVEVGVLRNRPPLDTLPESRCPRKLRALLLACWDHDPFRRPAAAELVKTLALVQEGLELERGDSSSAPLQA